MNAINITVSCSIWCVLIAAGAGVWALPRSQNDGKLHLVGGSTNGSTNADDVLTVASKNGAAEFAKLVKQTSWLSFTLMNTAGKVTVFAFSDAAYSKSSAAVKAALADKWGRERILQYHATLGEHNAADIAKLGTHTVLTSLFPSPPFSSSTPLQPLLIDEYEVEGASVSLVATASGAPISKANLAASNGLVHIVDKVIHPVPTGADMAKYLQDEPKYSRLYAALQTVNLTKSLSTPDFQPLTLLAPSDDAFKKLTPAQAKMLENTTVLTQVLTFHVVVGSYYQAAIYENLELTSLEGGTIYFEKGAGGTSAMGQMLTEFDTTVTNGVVHELAGVMFPRMVSRVLNEV